MLTIEAKEGVCGGSHFLLHCEVIVKGHFLHPRHQALIRIHWRMISNKSGTAERKPKCNNQS